MENTLVVDEKPRWATALLRPGILAFGGPIEPTALHAHHTVQMLVARTPVTVMDAGGVRHQGTRVIVPADAPYRIESAAEGATLYLDPETAAGAAAAADAHRGGWADDRDPLPATLLNSPIAEQVAAIVHALRATPPAPPHRHAAVTEALHLLPSLVRDRTVRGADVAKRVGLSPGRLSHLFTEQVGIPLRPYILWLRLRIAVARFRSGDDLATAAQAAGFDNGTDLTRTCRRTFGLSPTALHHAVHWDLGDDLR
ncbi:AraC family transcriptional regulator [Nocardia farcinica]|uniref:AraC family transcriptional regulator n=1 Tax=Nocardia farcinica TaxID=37329 RepID=UPI0018960750|nr:helix-turn-helix domain-containing protein [Nocardia farcinica]MBF6069679.1 AraC family transcriptional regulator [Nocardia farcinica]MBF6139185.1 AraC family transcriptional regulator [Nocardia farcinica]MBF6257385.1 AraC family transcriptional regulator [Nocardia farcinica]MBF6266176.1 AraC family transcriptional regulator [Nocardia farcinica]MBF6374215.1 AraC family transcriptional regulator [Nocardia farcinica]